MYKARQFLTKKALLMLYHAYIYPYMTYCIEVWGCASRVITFSHYLEPTESLFKDLKILAFKKLVIQRILLMMFKRNIGIVPKPISSLFTKKK